MSTVSEVTERIRNGEKIYETNSDSIRDAKEAAEDAQFDLDKYELQEKINALDDSLTVYNDNLDKTLDNLQKQSDKWSEIAEKIKQAQDELKANELLGDGWKDKVTSGNDTDIYNMFKNLYQTNADQIQKYEEQIKYCFDIVNFYSPSFLLTFCIILLISDALGALPLFAPFVKKPDVNFEFIST